MRSAWFYVFYKNACVLEQKRKTSIDHFIDTIHFSIQLFFLDVSFALIKLVLLEAK